MAVEEEDGLVAESGPALGGPSSPSSRCLHDYAMAPYHHHPYPCHSQTSASHPGLHTARTNSKTSHGESGSPNADDAARLLPCQHVMIARHWILTYSALLFPLFPHKIPSTSPPSSFFFFFFFFFLPFK